MIGWPHSETTPYLMGGRRHFTVGFLLMFMSIMALGSCAGANHCSRELARTQESLKAARDTAADLFAPDSLKKAIRLAKEAEEECLLQQDRFALVRSFEQARELHRQARQAADTAREDAELAQGLIKQEALNRRLAAREAVSRARGALTRAEHAKGAEHLADLRGELDQLDRFREQMQRKLDEGEYLHSREMADRILEEAIRLEAAANRRQMGLSDR